MSGARVPIGYSRDILKVEDLEYLLGTAQVSSSDSLTKHWGLFEYVQGTI